VVDDFNSGCGIDAKGAARAAQGGPFGFSDARCAALEHSYQQASTLAIVGFVASGVFAAAGFVLWATEPSLPSEGQTAQWTCAPALLGRDRPQLSCALRF
jgi:hypothetical protein